MSITDLVVVVRSTSDPMRGVYIAMATRKAAAEHAERTVDRDTGDSGQQQRRRKPPATRSLPIGLDDYERIGDPMLPYKPERRGTHHQRVVEQIRQSVKEQAACLPPPSLAVAKRVAELLDSFRRNPPKPWDLMRWRLRLYCGHLVERTAHRSHQTVHRAFYASVACPECGRDPVVIVAAEPIGLVGPPPSVHRAPSASVRPTRAQLERRVEELEAELKRLKGSDIDSGQL